MNAPAVTSVAHGNGFTARSTVPTVVSGQCRGGVGLGGSSTCGHTTAAPWALWLGSASLRHPLIIHHMPEQWAQENIHASWLSRYDVCVYPAELRFMCTLAKERKTACGHCWGQWPVDSDAEKTTHWTPGLDSQSLTHYNRVTGAFGYYLYNSSQNESVSLALVLL